MTWTTFLQGLIVLFVIIGVIKVFDPEDEKEDK